VRQCRQVNLLQASAYGTAKERAEGWRAVRFLVRDGGGHPAALVQVLAKQLPVVGGAARINRGPLLIGAVDPSRRESAVIAAIEAMIRECRRRHWWLLQIAPELAYSESAERGMRGLGFRRLAAPAWASGVTSLEGDEDQLMMALNGKWRNCLRKGVKLGVEVRPFEGHGPELRALLVRYHELQANRGFVGLSDKLLLAMADRREPDWRFTLFVAGATPEFPVSDAVGMLVSVVHGDTATYLIGNTNEQGRTLQANYVLLWRAMLHARAAGCRWFDIGGLNAATPDGIAHFKKGIQATPYELVGEWRRLIMPFGV
jgi:lipid II:glycine glycyltransferase (peptidoglycan interpeptide bridge formation enzyme)